MNSPKIPARQQLDGRAQPLVHWAATTSAAAIAATGALVVASLWVAAAFSSHNAGFYNHLDWWLGATLIGTAFVTAVLAWRDCEHQRDRLGVLNGLTSWAIIALTLGAVVLVAVATGGTAATSASSPAPLPWPSLDPIRSSGPPSSGLWWQPRAAGQEVSSQEESGRELCRWFCHGDDVGG